jgi:metallo-beta-lactamase family protein
MDPEQRLANARRGPAGKAGERKRDMTTSITFHGATDTVTGSRHLLETEGKRILVDCGLFQGPRAIRERNWQPFPVPPASLDSVVLTHAHLDHTGYLPRLVKHGYRGAIHCTPATRDLLHVMLMDSAKLQVEEAEYANRKKVSRHDPALPLYDVKDVERCLPLLEVHSYREAFEPVPGIRFHYQPAGHILGSGLTFAETEVGTVLFSGDLGRYNQTIIPDPTPVSRADYLLIESTYGNRDHQQVDVNAELARLVSRAAQERSFILVPSFAVGRTQELLYLLNRLWESGQAPNIPVYVDSPMAVSIIPIFLRYPDEHDVDMAELMNAHTCPLEGPNVRYVHSRDQSKALNDAAGPGMIIAGSGMANGGRIRHHLLNRVSDPTTTVLFVGYQGEGTPGRALLEGAQVYRGFGWEVPVRARMERLDALSAHADRTEMLHWLGHFTEPPRRTFLVHGEPVARQALQAKILAEKPGWNVHRPDLHERVELT